MQKLLFGLAALPFLASIAMAGQPLSDKQMDRVVAGTVFNTYFGCPPCQVISTSLPPATTTNLCACSLDTVIYQVQVITVAPQNIFPFGSSF
jgi:hypothetical protein